MTAGRGGADGETAAIPSDSGTAKALGADEAPTSVTVLCVDDDPTFLRLLVEQLESQTEEFVVRTATSGQAALAELADRPIDCIVSDYRMPGMDGLEFLEAVRADAPSLPFFLLTAQWTEVDAAEAIRAGVTDYIEKRSSERHYVLLANRIQRAVAAARAERDAERYGEILDSALSSLKDLFYFFDHEGRLRRWNDSVVEVTGYDAVELEGMEPTDFFEGEDADRIARTVDRVEMEGHAVTEAAVITAEGDRIPYEFTGAKVTDAAGELLGFCGIGRNLSERSEREEVSAVPERLLAGLDDLTEALLRAETRDDIASRAAGTARDLLGATQVGVYLLDQPAGHLARIATVPARSTDEAILPQHLDDGFAWEAFVEETVRRARDPPGDLDDGIAFPLGDHGTLVCADPTGTPLGDEVVEIGALVAGMTEAGLDRVAQAAELRSRDRKMDQQNDRLTRLNRITTLIRRIGRDLISADSRTAAEEAVCEALVAFEPIEFAWLCDFADGELSPRAWAGDDPPGGAWLTAQSAVDRAVRTRKPQVVGNLLETRHSEAWRPRALDRGYRSAITVPVIYRGVIYGILQIFAGEVDAVDPETRAVLGELGQTIGHALAAIDRRDALVGAGTNQLELQLAPRDEFFVRVAREAGGRVTLESIVAGQGEQVAYFSAPGVDAATVVDLAARSPSIEEPAIATERDDSPLFECRIVGSTILTTLGAHGGRPRSVVATPDGCRVVVDLPRSKDVRTFVEALRSTYSDVEILARRQSAETNTPGDTLPGRVLHRLTDRQREVLRAAYQAGFFQWPRDRTGEEMAARLDISPSTFHEHLRAAHRRILAALFDEG